MKFAIFGNTYQPKKSFHAANLFQLLKRQGAEICVCREFYQFLISEQMKIEADQLLDGDDFTADIDRKSTRLNSSHKTESRMPSSA